MLGLVYHIYLAHVTIFTLEFIMGPKKKIKLSNAEKQRLYHERRKNNPQKEEEAKKKDRER